MRTVFMHCGLHKTGTTAIQWAFAAHKNILRVNRVLYPRPDNLGGHHNLAWALTRDNRFDPAGMTWRTAIDEISAFDGDAVLSSEDFESVLHRPDVLSAIVKMIHKAGRELCLVIYVRKRDEYIESLYLELLKHGYAPSFGAYQREIRATGFLKYKSWVYQFDLDRVWSCLRGVPGLRFVRRDYQTSYGDSVIADFLSVLGLSKHALGQSAGSRVNQRPASAISLSQFMVNRLGRRLLPEEASTIANLLSRRFVQWSTGNPERPDHDQAGGARPVYYLNRVFSNHTVETIRTIASLAGARSAERQLAARKLQQLATWCQGGKAAEFVTYQSPAVLSRPPSFQYINKTAGAEDLETEIEEVADGNPALRKLH